MEQEGTKSALDHIINEMIDVVENSRVEIFNISEEARTEHDNLRIELADTKEKVGMHIKNGDNLERKVRISRKRLAEVSKYFDRYSEKDIRKVYEDTHTMQTELAILQQEEKTLRNRRDDLERRLIVLNQTIERAEGLGSKISVILPYLHDDFKQVNEMLEQAKEKQAFSLKIIQAQEDERRKISREIHDGPAQMLANILLRSELVERSIREQNIDHAQIEIKNIRKMIRSSMYEVRRIIYDLRPMALDDLGLVPTISKYVNTIADYNNMDIEFIAIGKEKRLSQEYEVAFFRLVQESLQNAIKHAEASFIKVNLEIRKNTLSMVVTDNGKGFNPNRKRDKSFGIIGMKERVEMLGGKITIDSEENRGTKIYVNVPYKNND